MANTYETTFLTKIAQKPEWLTESEKARTYASKEGWMYKDLTPNSRPELLVSIPNLSLYLEANVLGGVDSTKAFEVLFDPTNVGFTRRSRRRFVINVGLHEQLTAVGNNVTFTIDLSGANTVAQNAAGGDISSQISNTNPAPYVLTANSTIGKIPFEIAFDQDVTRFALHLASANSVVVANTTSLVDSEGHYMTTANSVTVNGYEFNIVGS